MDAVTRRRSSSAATARDALRYTISVRCGVGIDAGMQHIVNGLIRNAGCDGNGTTDTIVGQAFKTSSLSPTVIKFKFAL
jgi:hypothetical protein